MIRGWCWGGAAALVAAAIGVLGVPAEARACGGFFCNSQPMDQSGERIVFSVEDDGTTTTHVQILYQGTAESFAWILPTPSLPTLSVGTDVLFEQLDSSTRPQFRMDNETVGTCREVPDCPRPDYGDEYPGPSDRGGWADASAGADSGSGGVEVHFRDEVGPYDAAVISSTDPDAVEQWLADNEYDIPSESLPIIAEYVEKGDFFVALKLLTDRSAGEIQPIVLNYEERQPCIPIRLTAIATVPDMPITAWVLGDGRALPYNYMDVRPDLNVPELWLEPWTTNYTSIVTRAVDDAGGRGFVTDYAGAPPAVFLEIASIEDMRTITDPAEFVRQLQSRGFTGAAQLLSILLRFVPPPEGVDARSFFNCMVNDWCHDYDSYLDGLEFDPDGLVDALNEAIVTPRAEAQAMVERHPKLTRLFTTMSADEMTEDPVFILRDSAPDVSNIHTATLVTECGPEYFYYSAPQYLELPSGDRHRTREGMAYPGTDEEYCVDREDGVWGPGVSPEVAARTAERRRATAGGGGGCSAAPAAGGSGLAALVGLVGLVVWRRRRRR